MEYGEEDLDWKVVAIPGKGLGVVALRDIPPKYRFVRKWTICDGTLTVDSLIMALSNALLVALRLYLPTCVVIMF